MPETRKWGWKPDLPDPRDKLYTTIRKMAAVQIPDFVDLSAKQTPVEDQLTIGSCTANALVAAREFLDFNDVDGKYTDLSRMALYWFERQKEGTIDEDAGAFIRSGIKILVKRGVCPEYMWPYDVSKFKQRPPVESDLVALAFKVRDYHRVTTYHDLLSALAEGFPVVFGATIFTSFEKEEVVKTGKVEMPGDGDDAIGGHAILAVGYNKKDQTIKVKNSWGEKWGDKGYCYFPMDYFNPLGKLVEDCWVLRK